MSWPARWPATTSPRARHRTPDRRPMRSRPRRASPSPAAADRAAALGGYDQAVAYLGPGAGHLDRSGRARAAPRPGGGWRPASRRAIPCRTREGAIDAYRQLGDPVAALEATGRLGKLLIEGGEINRAAEVLEAALTEAESVADEATQAGILANLARVRMRVGQSTESIAAADRALEIAERLDLDSVVAEALASKGASLSQLGRRREAVALDKEPLSIWPSTLPRSQLRDAGPQQPIGRARRRRAGPLDAADAR